MPLPVLNRLQGFRRSKMALWSAARRAAATARRHHWHWRCGASESILVCLAQPALRLITVAAATGMELPPRSSSLLSSKTHCSAAPSFQQAEEKQRLPPGRVLFGKLCIAAEVSKEVIMSVVEDEQGCRHYVFVCNFACSSWSAKEARMWFPIGARVSIREPGLSFTGDGIPCLEVLNPASMEILGMDDGSSSSSSEDFWNNASRALQQGEFIRAAHLLSKCVDDEGFPELGQAYSERSEAWLGAGFHGKAVADADRALQLDPGNAESLLKKGRGLMGLQEYRNAQECFRLSGIVDESSDEATRCRALLEQSEHGIYKLEEYYLSRESRECTPECADFLGPVRIGVAPDGKGRGLFATEDLKAGDVIFVCNPLVAMFDGAKLPPEDDLLAELVRRCMASSRSLQQLVSLVDSEEIPELDLFRPNSNWLTSSSSRNFLSSSARIDIPACARRTSINYGYKFERVVGLDRQPEFLSGLWILTAFANHSCAPNASQKAVGSVSLVRAARDIGVGEEVTLPYLDPLVPWDVRSRQTRSRWGFECACERCKFEQRLHVENPGLFSVGAKMERLLEEDPSNLDLFELSEIACRVEKVISRWKGPSAEQEKHWMRASYYKAYEVYLQNREEFEQFIVRQPPPPWETIMEALHFTAPGHEGLLTLLLVFAERSNKGRARELLLKECVSCFGKQSSSTVKSILKLMKAEIIEMNRETVVSCALG